MKWAMVMVGALVLSMCSSSESVDTTAAEDAEITTTSTSTSTTTTTILGEGGLPTTEPPTEVPDLSGAWDAIKDMGGQVEEGTVLISQTGTTFTLSFSDGFKCRPADACQFDGTVEILENDDGDTIYVWMASNSGRADDEGGTYESFFGLQPASEFYSREELDPATDVKGAIDILTGGEADLSGWYVGIGQSVYRADGEEMVWDGYLVLTPFG